MKLLPLETQLTIRNCWRCRMTIDEAMTQKMLKEEYCKAVDDFAESVKNLIVDLSVIRFKDIDEIAEQLKVGDGR